jgi:hypothetical protein
MALAGAAAAAATAWMTQPAAGRLCPDIARVPILAGAIAAGLDVTVMESIMVESATYEQDVRDFCDDCGVRVKSVQNIFRDWHRSLKVGAALGAANVAGQVNLLVRAGVAGGEDAAATEARVKAALEASEKHEEDLSQRKYSLMLHMQQWQSTVAVGTDTDQPNTMLTKVYKAHVSMGGKTLKGSIIGGEFKFRQYMMEVKREASARGEMAFKMGADAFMAPLDDDCFGNWALFAAYAERWIQRYACDGLKVPFDEKLLESVKKEVAAKSFVSTNTSAMRDVEPKAADPSASAVAALELLARMLPGGGQAQPPGVAGHPTPPQMAGHSWGGGRIRDGSSKTKRGGCRANRLILRPRRSNGEGRTSARGTGSPLSGAALGKARAKEVSRTDGAGQVRRAAPRMEGRCRARSSTKVATFARRPTISRRTAR